MRSSGKRAEQKVGICSVFEEKVALLKIFPDELAQSARHLVGASTGSPRPSQPHGSVLRG